MASYWRTSAATPRAVPWAWSPFTAPSSFSTLRPLMATLAPAFTKASALPRLMPLLPPVMNATLPASNPSRNTLCVMSLPSLSTKGSDSEPKRGQRPRPRSAELDHLHAEEPFHGLDEIVTHLDLVREVADQRLRLVGEQEAHRHGRGALVLLHEFRELHQPIIRGQVHRYPQLQALGALLAHGLEALDVFHDELRHRRVLVALVDLHRARHQDGIIVLEQRLPVLEAGLGARLHPLAVLAHHVARAVLAREAHELERAGQVLQRHPRHALARLRGPLAQRRHHARDGQLLVLARALHRGDGPRVALELLVVLVQRVARHVEANGLLLQRQALLLRPLLHLGVVVLHRGAARAPSPEHPEERALPGRLVLLAARAAVHRALDALEDLPPPAPFLI